MVRKYAVITGIILSLALLLVSALQYPGGSQRDKHSVGFDWKNNYLCNLFDSKAVNGSISPSRPWADSGMLLLCLSFAIFFYRFSKKLPPGSAAGVIKYFGVGSMAVAILVVTPLHDAVITISGAGALLSMFYITVFVFKSKLLLMKVLCIICLAAFYGCSFVYYTRIYLEFLPIIQKVWFLILIIWVLCIEHFTAAADFQVKKIPNQQTGNNASAAS